jgi:hypothetical protein
MKVFLTARVSPSKWSINGTNLQNEGKLKLLANFRFIRKKFT